MSTLCMAFIESLLVRTKSTKYAHFIFFSDRCLFCIAKPLFAKFCFPQLCETIRKDSIITFLHLLINTARICFN